MEYLNRERRQSVDGVDGIEEGSRKWKETWKEEDEGRMEKKVVEQCDEERNEICGCGCGCGCGL